MFSIHLFIVIDHSFLWYLCLELIHHLLKQRHAYKGVVIVLNVMILVKKQLKTIYANLVDQLGRPWNNHVCQLLVLKSKIVSTSPTVSALIVNEIITLTDCRLS